jgi:hypothetical protein
LTEVSRLATRAQPGSIKFEENLVVLEPYQGMELFGGLCPQQRTGDPFIFRAKDKLIPRGMGRTLRFSFSLAEARSPSVVRYIAPSWWYGHCEEFSPEPLLPASNRFDGSIESAKNWLHTSVVKGGFEDGSLPRHLDAPLEGRHEPGWEGEIAGGAFLLAWRSGQQDDHDLAMRAAYVFTDVYVDHASKLVRMHGFAPPAYALPMNRIHGSFLAYLENGDPYLLETSRAVVDAAYALHKNSWPRLGVGRDACFIRGALLLARYMGDDHYRVMAQDAIADVCESQMPEGYFGDQGGGSGIHGWSAYIGKPWMGLMALGPLLDYLELYPEEERMLSSVKRFADWLMAERFLHQGTMGWSYQHLYRGGRIFYDFYKAEAQQLPTAALWHQDYLARLLTFCSIRFDDPRYLEAWVESYDGFGEVRRRDHTVAQTLQYVPWLQAKLCNARIGPTGVQMNPWLPGKTSLGSARVQTPDGAQEITFKFK